MFEHIVLFRMKPDAGPEAARELIDRLRALREKIDVIVDLSVGRNVAPSADDFQVGLVVRLRKPEDLPVYRAHPAHQEVLAYIEQVVDYRLAVDYEFPAEAGSNHSGRFA